MKEYGEDKADPQVNSNLLNKEFDIVNTITGEIVNTNIDIQEVKDMRKELQDLETDAPDSDQIILDNINRANRILDKLEEGILSGDHSARGIEVVGQLINAVTVAATSVTGISYNQQIIDNKNRALDIKEQEMLVKQTLKSVKGAENVNITNNNLVMTREDLLKMMEEN